MNLPRLQATRKTGQEKFKNNGSELPFSLLDFWQWSVSDLVSNATRGRLAEFLVARALGLPSCDVRDEWQAWDLVARNGTRVEVKSAAYLQSWGQHRFTRITFSIRESQFWDPETNKLTREFRRQADIYVFALLRHQLKQEIDPLNLDHWEFYATRTKLLNQHFGKCQSISLRNVQKLAGTPRSFTELSLMPDWQ